MHIETLRVCGLESLRSSFGLDFRSYIGTKFFMNKTGGNAIRVWGYSDPNDQNEKQKYANFRKGLKEYFGSDMIAKE